MASPDIGSERPSWRALSVAALVMAADQVTKQLVVNHVARREPVELIFGFEISNVRNSGIAFGLLEGSSDALVLALTLGALALLVGYFGRTRAGRSSGCPSGWWSAAHSATSRTGYASAPRSTSWTRRCGPRSTSPTSRSWPVWGCSYAAAGI